MKSCFSAFLIALFVMFSGKSSTAQAVYTQDFNFSGTLTSNSWTAHSGGGTNAISTTTGLTYTGHAGSGIGNAALVNNLSGEDDNQTFTSQTGTVYYSFLVNITDPNLSRTGDYFFHVGSPGGAAWTAYAGRVFARIVSGNVNFGISNTSTATYGPTNFSKNTTYLIIIKHTIVTGTTADPLSMWVLPSGMPASEFLAGAAEITNSTTSGTDAISAVGLRQGSATTSPQAVVDAIRVGTTWASVVPSSGSAPSTQASSIVFSNATTSSVTASWTAGNGDGRLVKINTTNTFTNPTGGATYTANATYSGSGEQVVSVGTSLSATVSNLTPGQTYYFRAYEYSNTGNLYNTTTTTGNPSSVTLDYPVPTTTALNPASATAGGSSFSLTVSGTGFYSTSIVNWNGSPRTTTYVNSTTLTASIGTADIGTAGSATVTVTNPAPGGGTSTAQTFTINASTSPIISVSSSLTPFITEAGTPSASQSYTVAGNNLAGDITVTAPSGFEIRTGSNPFSTDPIVLSYFTQPTIFTVEVAAKDATHPYFGTGSPNGYVLNGVQGPVLTMVRGVTYKFYFDGQGTCCSSTLGHPFIFTNSSIGGAANTGDVISDGVTQYGDSTFFTPDGTTPSTIYYMCDVHESMGSQINVIDPPTGSIAPTTIDIRFSPASSGSYSGSITHTSNSASTQTVALTGFALESEPVSPSTIAFGAITGTSIAVNTSGGTGASRIIVIRQASAVSYSPADGASVSGVNASFTTAADQGSGNKIVYDGTGNTVTVTGLSSSTTYHFAVYEYNGSGVTANYQITGAGVANTSTLASEPTTAATATLQRIKSDTSVVAFASGTGTNRLVVVSTSPVSFVPVDATEYTGASGNISTAADLGSGNLLIFNAASTTTITIRGLAAGTTYYLRAYEYNGSGSLINYGTSIFGSLTFTMPSNIQYNGGTYTQDFNSLPSTGSTGMTGFGLGPYYLSTPAVNASNLTGWQHTLIGGTSADVVFGIDNGTSSGGGVKSYGATGAGNRALGSLATASSVPCFGAIFVNNTGGPLTTITLSYTGQQWRNGGSGTPNFLQFSYALGSQDILNGVFSNEASLGFQNPISGGAAAGLDGTQPANQVPVNNTITLNANWMPGQTLVIRWTDNNDAGNDEGMAIDDLIFSAAGPTTPTVQDSLLFFQNVLTTSMDVNWSSGNGSARMVVMNTTNSFTNPVDGQTYTSNNIYSGSGEQVIFNGNGNVVHVDGLVAGTTYYFRVFGYNGFGASTKYNTSTALDNPIGQSTAAPSAATKLSIVSVNGFAQPVTGFPFSVVVQAQDSAGSPQAVGVPTTVSLTVSYGSGTLSGTTTGIIPAGSNSVTITGVVYSPEDFGVQLQADAIAGETLNNALSYPFDVLGVATQLSIIGTPPSGIVNTSLPAFVVQAYRNDFTLDPNFTGTVTLSKFSGPGNMSGTATAACVGGTAVFSNISFDAPGTYILEATSPGLLAGYSPLIVVTLVPTLTELVVPKYIAAKTAASAHNARVPFAVCLQIDNLVPNTAYDIKAGVGTDTTASTSYGSGNTWTGSSFAIGNVVNAFTTDANGSSGPFWVYLQPTANSTNSRFAAGFNHNLRIGFAPNGGIMPTEPNFVGTKLMTALDIGATAQTPATTDDGAFLTGVSSACVGGKYVLLFDNTTGTGEPISVYQSRTMVAPNTISQSELPTSVNDIYLQSSTASVGDYAALIPIGANNPNGIRRIEVRNTDNTLFNAVTSADGIWSATANTTTITRRSVAALTAANALLSTLSFTTTSTGESCTGTSDGTASVNLINGITPINYSWNSTPIQTTSTATGLQAGTYIVSVTDANGCSQTGSATVAAPSAATITAGGPTTFCSGGSVTLSVGAANSYLWSTGETTQSITVSTTGNYTATVSDGICTATSLPVSVTAQNYQFNGTLFTESMGSPTGTTSANTYTGWQNSAPITFNAGTSGTDVRNTTVSTGYVGASGGGNIFFGTTGGNSKTLTVSGINTSGYSNLVLTYGLLRSDLTNGMTVEVSTDGLTYTALTVPQPTVANTWQLMTVNSGIPAASNLRIRFSKNVTTSFRLDDIKIAGTTSTPSIATTGSTTVCGAGSVVLYPNIPSGLVWTFNGSTIRTQTVTASGSYTYVATDANGCSASASPVVFTINPEPTATASAGTIACNGGTTTINVSASNGTAPYTNTGSFTVSAGTYSYIVTDAVGCDDTVSTTVSQPAAISGSTTVSACGSYTWSLNGTTYTQSGSYTAITPAANGCDSTVTLNLTVTPVTTNTTTASSCDSYTWSLNGQTYTQSGMYSSVSGCVTDILDLTITPSTTSTSTAVACSTYTWVENGQTYTQSGTYTSVSGCATSVLNLTINTCNTGVTLNLTAYLQGYYSGTGTMVPVLANQGVSGAIGTETDTIIIELRDSLDPTIVVETAQAVLMTDGDATATFSTISAGTSYWIAVKHRASIQTWSSAPVLMSSSTSYDFTGTDTQAFGSNMTEVEPGVWAFYMGDLNQDEFVDTFDSPILETANVNFATGYLEADLNGDGFVDTFDSPLLEGNNVSFIQSIHP